MKTILLITFCFFTRYHAVAQEAITDYIEYDVPICDIADSASLIDSVHCLSNESIVWWIGGLLDSIQEGSKNTYAYADYFFKTPLSVEEIEDILWSVDSLFLVTHETGGGQVGGRIVETSYDETNVVAIRYREKWEWNKQGAFIKTVMGFCLILEMNSVDGEIRWREPVFCFNNKE